MKVTVNPDGTVEFDVATAAEALEIQAAVLKRAEEPKSVHEVLFDAIAKRVGADPEELAQIKAEKAQVEQLHRKPSMNQNQFSTWEVLVDNDCESGVHIGFVAEKLGVSFDATGQRLQRLAIMGHAKRVGAGRYRAL